MYKNLQNVVWPPWSPCKGNMKKSDFEVVFFSAPYVCFPPILAGTKSHLDHFHWPSKSGFFKFPLVGRNCGHLMNHSTKKTPMNPMFLAVHPALQRRHRLRLRRRPRPPLRGRPLRRWTRGRKDDFWAKILRPKNINSIFLTLHHYHSFRGGFT